MSRLRDARERVHQPRYDTFVRGIGTSSAVTGAQLFGNANISNRAMSNLQVAGQLAADATYILKSVRCVMTFQGLNDVEFTGAYGTLPALVNVVADNARAEDLYELVSYGATFTLAVGNKPMLNAPLWYAPAGGGVSGYTTENSRHTISNGLPTQASILKLAKDIAIAARQNFAITLDFFNFARLGPGAAGGVINSDIDPLAYLNQFDGLKLLQMHIDGVETRDIQ